MTPLSDLVLAMLDGIPLRAGGRADAVQVDVDELSVTMPLEARLGEQLLVSLPRRRTATGFDAPVHTVSLRLERRDP